MGMVDNEITRLLASHGYSERVLVTATLFSGGELAWVCKCGADIGAGHPSHVAAHQATVLEAEGYVTFQTGT